jgi:hypothetical protein
MGGGTLSRELPTAAVPYGATESAATGPQATYRVPLVRATGS